ncbi:Curli assembly protein CsgE [Lutibacter agarilyticus]|uniref:Curli production assembly/transport component CsgE n=1 Tax=Lutibacter agarilyticus TaxID=1109740 RepID=A0A238YSJ3_9FLAO|nr:CsgE family curli-type amyloid fiber assembly protein [Lutibacter agarilyticus]SNR73932.1 Curli assembly protein CsgE [Lutibacter agarilyticus]
MNHSFSTLIFLSLLFSTVTIKAQLSEYVVGKINVVEIDNFIIVKAHVDNSELIFKNNLTYNLVGLKKSVSGNYSSNRQSGEFSLKPQESKDVSELRLSIQSDEEIKVYLFIKHEDILVSKDSLLILPTEKKEKKNEVVNEGEFVITGIVVDDVITKMGKDFHDYFYQAYITSGIKYPFIINIKEKPYLGRNSIVSIEVDDRKIYEFMPRPDEEFLKSAVKQTLQNINQYAKQRKLLLRNSRI